MVLVYEFFAHLLDELETHPLAAGPLCAARRGAFSGWFGRNRLHGKWRPKAAMAW